MRELKVCGLLTSACCVALLSGCATDNTKVGRGIYQGSASMNYQADVAKQGMVLGYKADPTFMAWIEQATRQMGNNYPQEVLKMSPTSKYSAPVITQKPLAPPPGGVVANGRTGLADRPAKILVPSTPKPKAKAKVVDQEAMDELKALMAEEDKLRQEQEAREKALADAVKAEIEAEEKLKKATERLERERKAKAEQQRKQAETIKSTPNAEVVVKPENGQKPVTEGQNVSKPKDDGKQQGQKPPVESPLVDFETMIPSSDTLEREKKELPSPERDERKSEEPSSQDESSISTSPVEKDGDILEDLSENQTGPKVLAAPTKPAVVAKPVEEPQQNAKHIAKEEPVTPKVPLTDKIREKTKDLIGGVESTVNGAYEGVKESIESTGNSISETFGGLVESAEQALNDWQKARQEEAVAKAERKRLQEEALKKQELEEAAERKRRIEEVKAKIAAAKSASINGSSTDTKSTEEPKPTIAELNSAIVANNGELKRLRQSEANSPVVSIPLDKAETPEAESLGHEVMAHLVGSNQMVKAMIKIDSSFDSDFVIKRATAILASSKLDNKSCRGAGFEAHSRIKGFLKTKNAEGEAISVALILPGCIDGDNNFVAGNAIAFANHETCELAEYRMASSGPLSFSSVSFKDYRIRVCKPKAGERLFLN